MIDIDKERMCYRNSALHNCDISYKSRINTIKQRFLINNAIPKCSSDGSIEAGLCNNYALSINDKFKCPLDTRKRIDTSEKYNLFLSSYNNKYLCEKYCVKQKHGFFEEGTNVISEKGIEMIKKMLKDFIPKS